MTSGVYPRKPGAKAGRKPLFDAQQVAKIRAKKLEGDSAKFLAAYWHAGEKTIYSVINGRNAYKGM